MTSTGSFQASKRLHESSLNAIDEDEVTSTTFDGKSIPMVKFTIDDFDVGRPLGRGKFGYFFLAREKKSHYLVALKIIFKSKILKHQIMHQIRREIEVQTQLRHSNIVRMYGYFSDDTKLYLILEFAARGSLYKHLQKHKYYDEKTAATYMAQLAHAFIYCHSNDVIHHDIKPENLLISLTGEVKIANFGWSVQAPSMKRKDACNTLGYLPPEMLDRKVYDIAKELWCLGILCYEFLVGKRPAYSEFARDTNFKQVALKFPNHVSADAQDFVLKLLRNNPTERMTLNAILDHPWIVQNAKRS